MMRRNIWAGVLGVGLLAALAWGFNNYRLLNEYKLTAENNQRRAFAEFASQLDQLETDMAKQDVANSSQQRILYLSRISTLSRAAGEDLAQLPAEEVGLSYLGQFLTQIGEYAGIVAQRAADQGGIGPEDEKNLNDLRTQMQSVNTEVQELAIRVAVENLDWLDPKPSFWQRIGLTPPKIANATAEGEEASDKSVRSGLDQLEASLQKLPPFSYEGEYASRTVAEPLGLPKDTIDQDQAMSVAREFLYKAGYPDATPQFSGEIQGPMGGFAWSYKDVYLEVSRQGGLVTTYRDQRSLEIRTMDLDTAKKKAMDILSNIGWQGLVLTSTEDFGSYLQLEAVLEENGVRIYPDKVRMILALDNGQIIGYDATPYLAFHQKRTLNTKLSMAEARAKLRSGFTIKENRLAVIAAPGNKEVFCYEFRGTRNNEEYLVYINAATGIEEKIERIIRTPRGEYLE